MLISKDIMKLEVVLIKDYDLENMSISEIIKLARREAIRELEEERRERR